MSSLDDFSLQKTIELMRLILLGQLIEKTGILWIINVDHEKYDARFFCKYGFAKYELLAINIDLLKTKEYLEDMMNEVSWDITKAYHHRQKTKHNWGEE